MTHPRMSDPRSVDPFFVDVYGASSGDRVAYGNRSFPIARPRYRIKVMPKPFWVLP